MSFPQQESSTGDGPVAACIRAIKRSINLKDSLTMEHYQVRSVTGGKDAQGEVTVRLRSETGTYTGRGISTDTIEASVLAYLQALNNYVYVQDVGTLFENISAA